MTKSWRIGWLLGERVIVVIVVVVVEEEWEWVEGEVGGGMMESCCWC